MSFIETEASYRIEIINGKPVKIITPQTEVTLTNMKTGQEYNSDAEAMQDVQNPETETVADDIKRDVKVTVEALPLGGDTKLQYNRTMAITRAQQVRQMLEDGGMLVKPSMDGKRPGYRSARAQENRSKGKTSTSRSTGPSFNDVSRASNEDRRQTYSAVQTQTGKVKGGGKGIGTDKRGNVVFEDDRPSQKAIDNAKKFQEEQKRKREETIKKSRSFNPFPLATSVFKVLK